MVAPSVRARYVTKDGVPFDVVRTPVRNEWARGTDYTAELPRTNDSPFAPTQIGYTRLRNKGQAPGPGTEQYLPQASDDLTVHPDYRRQGVATAMYDEAERWRQVRPATNLTEQGQEFWGNRDPEKVRTMLRAQFDQHVDNVRAGRVNPDFVHGFLDYHPDQYSAPGVNRLAVEEADRARKVLYKEGLLPPAVDYDTPPAMRGTPGVDHWTPALEAAQRRQALQGVLGLGTGGAPKPK
jgi:GNAT superfamily N-acetyltransferase